MKLFDEFSRTYEAPAGYGEPEFDYLNRSANEPICKIRDVLENWFSHYPEKDQFELRQRFRSQDEHNHCSAFFELWLHEMLLCLGYSIEVHPSLPRTNRKPDFRVESPQDNNFYLEAIHATGASGEDSKSQTRLNVLYDSLNYLDSPDFFINLDVDGSPKTSIPAKRIRESLERELSRLNPKLIDRFIELGRLDLLPRWRFEHEGLRITCYATPKPPELRGVPGVRTLATTSFGGIIDSEGPIRDAVIGKAKRYGVLDLPLVVAVNATDHFISERDVMSALYGSVSGWVEPELLNDSRGVWGSVNKPRWTRLSAVMVTVKLRASKMVGVPVCLYHSPRPKLRYAGELTRLCQVTAKNNRLIKQNGETPESILRLPPDFPE
jgi:hypothetical protein